MWDKLFASSDLLQKGLDAAWKRDAVIRNNIANAATPGFKSSDIEFESVFKRAIESELSGFQEKRTREKHISFADIGLNDVEPHIVKNETTSMLMNENNVDIEAENVKLAQNSLFYNTVMTKLNSELARIKMAVNEGR